MKYSDCFFDLDGTLIDSSLGVFSAVRYALDKLGKELPDDQTLHQFIGPPLLYSFVHFCNMSESEAMKTVEIYREYYSTVGVFECHVYDGIVELLRQLRKNGIKCVLATCKPHIFARRILEHLSLSQYFDFISGPELDGTRGEKDEVIAYALQGLQISDTSTALMIGDRGSDILGASKNAMAAAGCLWGFGSREELLLAGAIKTFSTPSELQTFLCGE